jgi:hypothetical protein
MERKIKYTLLFFATIGFYSCEELILKDDPPNDPLHVFDYLWNDVNNRYSYFEEKNINWDSLGIVYRGKLNSKSNSNHLFNVMSDMLFELRDGHVNLLNDLNRSRYWEWFRNYPNNYNEDIIESRYLGKDFLITGPFRNTIIDSILYVNYRSFSSEIKDSHLNQLMETASGLKGVIIDVRSNGGGNMRNAYMLASCFTDHSYEFAKQRIKSGPGKNEFSAWTAMRVNPKNGKRFSGPVVILTNRRSYSATTYFAQMMKLNSRAILIGDNTGGGGGSPVSGELPNGWEYRFSASQAINPEGEHLEFGISVEIKVNMRYTDEQAGFDTIIERGLGVIKGGG